MIEEMSKLGYNKDDEVREDIVKLAADITVRKKLSCT